MVKNSIDSEKAAISKIERLIIYTVALLVIVVFILQTDFSILAIIPFIIFYFFIIIYNIILPFLKDKQQNENLKKEDIFFFNTSSINIDKLKKIAVKNYYYDNGIFYKINEISQKSIAIPFTDIIEVSKTDVTINNVRIWKVIAQHDNKKVTYKFKHNYSLWNNNFPDFLAELKRENPNAKISKFELWKK